MPADWSPFELSQCPVVAAAAKSHGCGVLRPWSLQLSASCDFHEANLRNRELKNIDHHHPGSKKRKSSEGNSGSIQPYGRYGNAGKTSDSTSTIATLWPVKAISEKRATSVEVDTSISFAKSLAIAISLRPVKRKTLRFLQRNGCDIDPAASSRPPPGQRSHSRYCVAGGVRRVVLLLSGCFLL